RGGGGLRQRGDPGPRRIGLRGRLSGRALPARRAGHHPVRGHLPDPQADHRPGRDRDQRDGPAARRGMTIERVGVVGAGTMGAGIPQIAALGGYETFLYEIDEKQLERGLEMIRNGMRRGAERGRWSEPEAAEALERLRSDTLIGLLRDGELVIEAAPEDLARNRN